MSGSRHSLFIAGAGGGGAGTFRDVWDAETEYLPGDIVIYGTGRYCALEGADAGVAPYTLQQSLAAAPASTDTTDQSEYELISHLNWVKPVRVVALGFPKVATQTQVPHVIKLWDKGLSTTVAIASTSVPGETQGQTGLITGPVIADVAVGNNYAVSYVVGQGTDAGYRFQASDTFPKAVGSGRMTGAGFGTLNNIGGVNANNGTNYGAFAVWEEIAEEWTLLGRVDPIVAGSSRAASRMPF